MWRQAIGRLWFVVSGAIGVMTSVGAVTATAAPNSGGAASAIVSGPDGALWFTEPGTNRIGRVDTHGDVFDLNLPTDHASPTNLVVGADGALWFTENSGNKMGRIVPGIR